MEADPVKDSRIFAGLVLLGLAFGSAVFPDEVEDTLNGQRNFNAMQTVYQHGVPHTDRQGRVLTEYDPDRSFFQIGIWGAPLPGQYWDSKVDWKVLKDAGFNTVWPWAAAPLQALETARSFQFQIVVMGEMGDDVLAQVKDHPNLLGNVWMDEPIGGLGSRDMDELFGQFTAYRERVKAVLPDLPVFINDAPWIMPPATSWWLKWNSSGDVSCHDNYPVMNHTNRAVSIGAEPNGIPQSVSLAVADVRESKPVWLIVGAFETPGPYGQAFPFRFPTPEQLRACVYSGIIHGATGIIYFTWDTYVPRDGSVIGMAPDPKPAYTPNPKQEGYTNPTPATPMQLTASRALWDAARQINLELAELTPFLFTPTAGPEFQCTLAIEGKAPTATPLRVLPKPISASEYLLLTVNQDDAVLKATYKFSRPLARVETLYENQLPLQLEPDAKQFELTYEPFAVHVIRVALAQDTP